MPDEKDPQNPPLAPEEGAAPEAQKAEEAKKAEEAQEQPQSQPQSEPGRVTTPRGGDPRYGGSGAAGLSSASPEEPEHDEVEADAADLVAGVFHWLATRKNKTPILGRGIQHSEAMARQLAELFMGSQGLKHPGTITGLKPYPKE